MNRYIRILLITILLLSIIRLSSAEGEKAFFSLKDETGTVYTRDKFKGKELAIFVFTFECPHCRRAMPVIQELYDEGHAVLGVAYSTYPQDLDGKRKKSGLTFPIVIGTKAFQRNYNIRGVPTMVLIAPDGIIKERFSGSKGAKRLRELLRKEK